MRKLAWMAAPRREWLKFVVEVIAAAGGVTLESTDSGASSKSGVMPYNPAVLEAMANSGKGLVSHGR